MKTPPEPWVEHAVVARRNSESPRLGRRDSAAATEPSPTRQHEQANARREQLVDATARKADRQRTADAAGVVDPARPDARAFEDELLAATTLITTRPPGSSSRLGSSPPAQPAAATTRSTMAARRITRVYER